MEPTTTAIQPVEHDRLLNQFHLMLRDVKDIESIMMGISDDYQIVKMDSAPLSEYWYTLAQVAAWRPVLVTPAHVTARMRMLNIMQAKMAESHPEYTLTATDDLVEITRGGAMSREYKVTIEHNPGNCI